MAREPKRVRPAEGYLGEGGYGSDGPPTESPPLYRAGRATPDRSQRPPIGPAAGTTRAYLVDGEAWAPAPRFTDELRQGVELATTCGNNEVQKTAQEFGDARRQARGVQTRPVRPGRANYG